MTILAFSVTIFENEITTKSKYLPPAAFGKSRDLSSLKFIHLVAHWVIFGEAVRSK
jgi:hypothetical protein